MKQPIKLPEPTPLTFGDRRPAPIQLPGLDKLSKRKPRRRLKPGCSFPDVQTYRQTNGPLYLTRFRYNGVWISGIGSNEASAIDNAQQFYMMETRQGRDESELVDG